MIWCDEELGISDAAALLPINRGEEQQSVTIK